MLSTKRKSPEAADVGARIRALRQHLGLTQEQFAEKTGVFKREEITQAENGTTLAKTERWGRGIGNAAGAPAHIATDYLRGRIALGQLMAKRGVREDDERPRSREQTIRDAAFWEKIPPEVIDDFFASRASTGLATMPIADALHFMKAMVQMQTEQPPPTPAKDELEEMFAKKKSRH